MTFRFRAACILACCSGSIFRLPSLPPMIANSARRSVSVKPSINSLSSAFVIISGPLHKALQKQGFRRNTWGSTQGHRKVGIRTNLNPFRIGHKPDISFCFIPYFHHGICDNIRHSRQSHFGPCRSNSIVRRVIHENLSCAR